MVAILVVLSVMSPVFASTEPGHRAACAYVKAVPGSPCTWVAPVHSHDAACGYIAAVPGVSCDCNQGGVVSFAHRIQSPSNQRGKA